MSSDKPDRRREVRSEGAKVAVATVLARHNSGVPFVIESLSAGGARLAGPLALQVNERIHILFELDGHPIEVLADVVRVQRDNLLTDRVAVTFVEVTPATRELLRKLVRHTIGGEEAGSDD